MESLDQLRRQMEIGDELGTLVRTMKALSAVSVRQHERAVRALHAYGRTIDLGLQVVLREPFRYPVAAAAPAAAEPTTATTDAASGTPPDALRRGPAGASPGKAHAAIVFGSDHGLCGRFNDDVVEHALATLQPAPPAVEPTHVLAVGTLVAARLEPRGIVTGEVLALPGSTSRITETVRGILLRLDAWRAEGIGTVRLIYNGHRARSRYAPVTQPLLPLDFAGLRALGAEPWPSRVIPTFTMPRERLLAALVRQHLFVRVFSACAESLASEHGARLAAMQSAEQSLAERNAELTMSFRRRRQDEITAELLDVISGYEALTARQP
jgi:F-type H+-transporting ATPase subunit gamma